MMKRNLSSRGLLAALLAPICLGAMAQAQQPGPLRRPGAERRRAAAGARFQPPKVVLPGPGSLRPPDRERLRPGKPGEHPLMPALRWAQQGIRDVGNLKDYSTTMVRRDRMGGKVGPYQYAFVKVRHQPLSFYMRFLAPDDVKGQEAIWIKGRNKGLMWAHGTGIQRKLFGTISLRTNGPVAMRGQRYPITELGILNMLRRLVEVGQKDSRYGECEVRYFENVRVNDRPCICIQVLHPVPRRNFLFNVARIYVDNELNVPIRYEAWDWPDKRGDPPLLSEEYTFLNLKLNVGFTDADFDIRNPNYNFP